MSTLSDDPIGRFEEAFAKVAATHGLTREAIGRVKGDDLVFWTRAARRGPGTSVFLSSGIHGDEPCGPLAMLEFLQSDLLPDDCEWVIAPLLNPSGLRAGTRENAEGIDLNRDFFRQRSEEVNAVTAWWSRSRRRCDGFRGRGNGKPPDPWNPPCSSSPAPPSTLSMMPPPPPGSVP